MGANWLPSKEPVWLRPFRDGLTFLGFEDEFASDAVARLVAATDNRIYQMLLAAVVYPRAPGDLTRSVRAAQATGVAVSPRGYGTGNNRRLLTADVIVNFTHHPVQIGTLEAEASLVTVEPGVVLDQLNAFSSRHGLFFAPMIEAGRRPRAVPPRVRSPCRAIARIARSRPRRPSVHASCSQLGFSAGAGRSVSLACYGPIRSRPSSPTSQGARMMDDPRSHGLWEASALPAPDTDPLRSNLDADVVVIGGGFTGLSAALHLAEGGASVAVLEGVEIGFGGSGRNVGLVNAGMWVMPDELPAALGDVHGRRLLALLGDAPRVVFDLVERHGIACEVERTGTLHCAVGPKGLAEVVERARQWRERGAPVEVLDAAETGRMVGTRAYSGSLLDRRAGTIQPLGYARGLAHAAIMAGARVFTRSPVVSATQAGDGWLVRTDAGCVRARWVVVATNAYTGAVWPEIRSEIVHLPYFNLATTPLGNNVRRSILPERQGVWDTRQILSSFRFDRRGRLVFGSVGALRGTGTPIHRDWGRRALRRLFPQLQGVAFEHEWHGKIGMTENSLPRFHRLAPKVVAFSGYNGRGIAPGTVFGRCLADLALGRISEDDLPLPATEPVAARHRFLREVYYEVGAQVAHAATARF